MCLKNSLFSWLRHSQNEAEPKVLPNQPPSHTSLSEMLALHAAQACLALPCVQSLTEPSLMLLFGLLPPEDLSSPTYILNTDINSSLLSSALPHTCIFTVHKRKSTIKGNNPEETDLPEAKQKIMIKRSFSPPTLPEARAGGL